MERLEELKVKNRIMKSEHDEKLKNTKMQQQQKTMGLKRVMVT